MSKRAPQVEVEWEIKKSLEEAVDRKLLESVLAEALVGRGLASSVAVGLVITDDEEIRELNHRYRGIDSPTDVLSFPLQEYESPEMPGLQFPLPPAEPLPLGDIVISYPRAVEQAREYGHSLERELAFLAIHGMMHLLGYDHEDPVQAERMRSEEEAVLQRMGLGR
ncbi:MAG: rRNA maturation RNase YbeY [Sphingomonadaceae bacterium]